MSSIERKAIIKQKENQLMAITLEHEKWAKKLSESGKNCDEIQNEYEKFMEKWIQLALKIDAKVEPFFDGTEYPENLKPVHESDLLQVAFEDAHEEYHKSVGLFEFMEHTRELTWDVIVEAAGILDNPNSTLEQIQTLAIPNFDWAENNYHPSFFDVNFIKEMLSSVMNLLIEYDNSVDIEILIRKVEEVAVEEEGDAKKNDAGNEAD